MFHTPEECLRKYHSILSGENQELFVQKIKPPIGEKERNAMTKNIDNKNEVLKIVHTMKADAEEVNQKIREAAALFKAVQYSVSENILDEDETDNCLMGFSFLMDSLLELSDNCFSVRTNPYVEVDILLPDGDESGVEQ